MEVVTELFFYIVAFIAIWLGAGLIIQSVDRISHKIRVSSFAISFLVLGLLTSIPEMAVGVNAVIDHNPKIFIGTLLGGTVVIFLLIIPLFAILGNGVKLNHDLDTKNLLGLLGVIGLPGLIIIDQKVTPLEGIFLILAYIVIFYFIQKRDVALEENSTQFLSTKSFSFLDLIKVAVGIAIVFISSQVIVAQTLEFAKLIDISAFYISIVVLSLGTNLPEMSLAIRAVISGKKDIAFGDYLGSAAANTLLFGIFTLTTNEEVLTENNFILTFLFIASGICLFYFFSQSKKDISRKEGLILLGLYVVFIVYELGKGFLS